MILSIFELPLIQIMPFIKGKEIFGIIFLPETQDWDTRFYKALLNSPFRKQLEEKWGTQLFKLAEYELKAFSPEIIPLLQEENKLTSEYSKLVASAQVEFQGKTYTLANWGLSPNIRIDPFEKKRWRQEQAFSRSIAKHSIPYMINLFNYDTKSLQHWDIKLR